MQRLESSGRLAQHFGIVPLPVLLCLFSFLVVARPHVAFVVVFLSSFLFCFVLFCCAFCLFVGLCALCFARLCFPSLLHPAEAAKVMLASGIIKLVVAAMRAQHASVRMQKAGCGLLANLAYLAYGSGKCCMLSRHAMAPLFCNGTTSNRGCGGAVRIR